MRNLRDFPFVFSVLFGLSRQMVIASYLTTPDKSFRKVWWDLAGEISPQELEGSSKSLRRGSQLWGPVINTVDVRHPAPPGMVKNL